MILPQLHLVLLSQKVRENIGCERFSGSLIDVEVVIHAGLRLTGAVPMFLEASLVNAWFTC